MQEIAVVCPAPIRPGRNQHSPPPASRQALVQVGVDIRAVDTAEEQAAAKELDVEETMDTAEEQAAAKEADAEETMDTADSLTLHPPTKTPT